MRPDYCPVGNEPCQSLCDEPCSTQIKEALAQPEQEPVAFVKGCNRGQWEIFPAKAYQIFERDQPLYTTPPQRKPLSDEEIDHIAKNYALNNPTTPLHFARAIEAAHGIKENT